MKYYKDQSWYKLTGTPSFHAGDIIKHKWTRRIYKVIDQIAHDDVIVENPNEGKVSFYFGDRQTEKKFISWMNVRLLSEKEYKKYNKNPGVIV